MPIRTVIRRGYYQDSVALMRLSGELSTLEGIRQASALMGTDANKALLEAAGLLDPEGRAANPNDLLLAIQGDSDSALQFALEKAVELLEPHTVADGQVRQSFPQSIASGVERLSEANLVLVSTPGAYAGAEALKALKAGLHVFLFSDNVPLEQEVQLKREAKSRGLLLMGPDCGTAILAGTALGFANVLDRGPIGIVGPSGTGIQQVTVLVHRYGSGVSQAIGTGGRDLSKAVGGVTTLQGLDALAEDAETKVVVVVAKPSDPIVAQRIIERCRRLGKPAVVNFLGLGLRELDWRGVTRATTLEETASLAVAAVTGRPPEIIGDGQGLDRLRAAASRIQSRLEPEQRYLRGLYSGGTLCAEALVVLAGLGIPTYSNIHLPGSALLQDVNRSREHSLIDMGADEFTVGRPHPMIDFRARLERLERESRDPSVAVILLDVVLGFGAHMNPAEELAPAIREAVASAQRFGRNLAVVGSVCGTDRDPQQLGSQEARLAEAGMVVLPSNVQAARFAAAVAANRLEFLSTEEVAR